MISFPDNDEHPCQHKYKNHHSQESDQTFIRIQFILLLHLSLLQSIHNHTILIIVYNSLFFNNSTPANLLCTAK